MAIAPTPPNDPAEVQRGFAAFPLFHLLGVEKLRGRRAVTEGHLDVNRHLRSNPSAMARKQNWEICFRSFVTCVWFFLEWFVP